MSGCPHQEALHRIIHGLVGDYFDAMVGVDQVMEPFGLAVRAGQDKSKETFELVRRANVADLDACPVLTADSAAELAEKWRPTISELVKATGSQDQAKHLSKSIEVLLALQRLDVCHSHAHQTAQVVGEELSDLLEVSGAVNMPGADA